MLGKMVMAQTCLELVSNSSCCALHIEQRPPPMAATSESLRSITYPGNNVTIDGLFLAREIKF